MQQTDHDYDFLRQRCRIDNPALRGKPLIIGSLPHERGVVATCSYEARKFGVHSAMNIKEAFRRCPQGIYMHPNFDKYKAVSEQLNSIWNTYATVSQRISLDEAYLDVTEQTAKKLLEAVDRQPVRLVGASLYNLSQGEQGQMVLQELFEDPGAQEARRKELLGALGNRYGLDFAGHLE